MALNYSGAFQGGLGGAGTGAGIGSMFGGPVGAGIGGGLGGILGILGGLFGGGNQPGMRQAQRFNPQQQNAMNSLLSMGQQNLQNPYQGFEPIRQAATSDFFKNIIPQLQTQFSASGSNAASSPQLQTNLSSAAAGLAERLAAMQSQFGQQNQQNAVNQLHYGLQPQFENYYEQGTPGFGENLLSSLFKQAPEIYKQYQLENLIKALQQGGK